MNAAACPKCQAALPPRGRFCLECGCDLYEAGVRRRPARWVAWGIALLAIALVVALAALTSRGKLFPHAGEAPPEERAVRELTLELLQLAAAKDYAGIVRRFVEPNADEFRRAEETLGEIVRGRGAPGLTVFRASTMDDLEEAKKFIGRYRPQHPDYLVAVLTDLTFQDGALRSTLGGAPLGAQRAADFCAWHLALAFRGLDAKAAEVTDVRWHDGPGGERLLAATIRYPEAPAPIGGVMDPSTLYWRLVGDNTWALTFGDGLRLDEILAFLLQVKL